MSRTLPVHVELLDLVYRVVVLVLPLVHEELYVLGVALVRTILRGGRVVLDFGVVEAVAGLGAQSLLPPPIKGLGQLAAVQIDDDGEPATLMRVVFLTENVDVFPSFLFCHF